jgi:hypothetical protein
MRFSNQQLSYSDVSKHFTGDVGGIIEIEGDYFAVFDNNDPGVEDIWFAKDICTKSHSLKEHSKECWIPVIYRSPEGIYKWYLEKERPIDWKKYRHSELDFLMDMSIENAIRYVMQY